MLPCDSYYEFMLAATSRGYMERFSSRKSSAASARAMLMTWIFIVARETSRKSETIKRVMAGVPGFDLLLSPTERYSASWMHVFEFRKVLIVANLPACAPMTTRSLSGFKNKAGFVSLTDDRSHLRFA